MKIRNGFVSNSSSSSFVCCISGEVESGYDLGIRDAGYYECKNGHVFCESFVLPAKDQEEDEEEEWDWHGLVDPSRCPVCQLKEFDKDDLIAFALKKLGTNRKELGKEIAFKFASYDEFQSYLKA
jgi:hypothetical protein